MRIILAGGGTGGSVSPLLAIADAIKSKNPEAEFLFIGTKKGIPEKELCKMYKIPFKSIFSGKLRRYISIRNIIDPFFIFVGFKQTLFILLKYKPHAIVSAGGFVAVPVSYAGWLLHIPIFAHQQDIIPGLANKLIAPIAKKITISFEKSSKDFSSSLASRLPFGSREAILSSKKVVLTGNPIRARILQGNKERAVETFNLEDGAPTLLVIGGGTGALKINKLIAKIIPDLAEFCQIIHITGSKLDKGVYTSNRYHQYEFLKHNIADAYMAADLVISRAGMGVLTELAVLGKPTIIIPIPDSHQENNASYFNIHKAAIVLDQKILTSQALLDKVHTLLSSADDRAVLSLNISKLGHSDAAQKIAELVLKTI